MGSRHLSTHVFVLRMAYPISLLGRVKSGGGVDFDVTIRVCVCVEKKCISSTSSLIHLRSKSDVFDH